ncbi:hypothetical protein [Paenibacillus cucumis (ex Kampfer et al. 2016)]|uniref:Tail fiber domain-containing protein n=1 Tax=Paenibacillus cucumis (ex Kampfer et al. 2016) TaxID=1776858 RepID=A0ABS7KM95_9BACL|nr:hypothetical protein [Paenibacillus cucumis (ex Kampfer et al. 2016)]MBY0205245.1 hypothetical protein [Paenibacillus cucumis (ex Kampfer et al. 2016)]
MAVYETTGTVVQPGAVGAGAVTTPKTTTPTSTQNIVQQSQQVQNPVPASPSSLYNIGVRQALNGMGVDNKRIGYNNGYVTIDGQNVIRPQVNAGGTSYTSQGNLNSIQGQVNQLNQANTIMNRVTNPQATVNPYDTQINDVLAQLTQGINNPAAYDPYASPEYAAYQAQAQRNTQQGIRTAQEALGASGLGRSSILSDRAQGIQNDANEYMQLQVIPQLIAANQAAEQQKIGNLANLMGLMSNQQGLYDARDQNQFNNSFNVLGYLADQNQRGLDNARADAGLTGNYLTPEARDLLNNLLGLKQQAEAKGITKDARAGLSKQADGIRDQLSVLGVDTSQLGANTSYSNASKAGIGRTLQGQQVDMDRQGQQFNQGMQTRQQNFNEKQTGLDNQFRDRQQTFNEGQTSWENSFNTRKQDFAEGQQAWQNSFDSARFEEDKRQYGLNHAIDEQAQNLRKEQFDYEKETNKQSKKDMESAYKSELADMILSQNLSDEDTKALLKKYGITDAMIQEYMSGPGNL